MRKFYLKRKLGEILYDENHYHVNLPILAD